MQLFAATGVYVHRSSNTGDHVAGVLTLTQDEEETDCAAEQSAEPGSCANDSADCAPVQLTWAPVELGDPQAAGYAFRIALTDIASVLRAEPRLGWPYIIINVRSGVAFPPLYFHLGTPLDFLAALDATAAVVRDSDNLMLYHVIAAPAWSATPSGHSAKKKQQPEDEDGVRRSQTHHPQQQPARDLSDVQFNVLEHFSKVTKLARDLLDPEPRRRVPLSSSESFRTQSHAESVASTNVGQFELLLHASQPPTTLPNVVRTAPLCRIDWDNAFAPDGRLVDPTSIRETIFRGGVTPELRPLVWPFVFGVFPWTSTASERLAKRRANELRYAELRRQWSSIQPDQEANFAKFRHRKHRIDKDVVRTDRTHELFQDDDSPYLVKLHDILLSYAFYNFDVGYVQGMSDLLAPLLVVMRDEQLTFWIFVGVMDRIHGNFHKDQSGMHRQLRMLRNLTLALDPTLYRYLDHIGATHFFFAFRWLLIVFKREFSFPSLMLLWEAIWTCPLHPNLEIFVALAVLRQHRDQFIRQRMQFDDMLKYVNNLSNHIDIELALCHAETLIHQFRLKYPDGVDLDDSSAFSLTGE